MIRIVAFEDRWARDFERLNREWIERYFSIEPEDERLFADPRGEIIDRGGEILMALDGDRVIGTVALVVHGPDGFELAKMAVSPAAQGRGVGRRLLETAVSQAREAGKRSVVLSTNIRLGPALHLYESVGFCRVLATDDRFVRADLVMELHFAAAEQGSLRTDVSRTGV